MPELPEIAVYVEALTERIVGQTLGRAQIASPFLLRTVDPPVAALEGRQVASVHRMGKRIVWSFSGGHYAIFHLMLAGRFRWLSPPQPNKKHPRQVLAAFAFPGGTLILTEAGTKKRASLHIVAGTEGLRRHDPGGLEVLEASAEDFAAVLQRENHTLKRALTDPHLFSGIGNTYSDEILFRARLSPLAMTVSLTADEIERLRAATEDVLAGATASLRRALADSFPEPQDLAAAKASLSLHGKYGQPCPECGAAIQRICYAEHETNYCPGCQTEGRLLADRALSRLLKKDWPRTLEELEARRSTHPNRNAVRTTSDRNTG
ncbi:MAG: DNA-formamidopyrimidine glycosylase family protein [Pseudomonadota bacterium]